MTALVLEPFNDISVKKLSDEQIIQREMLQQFVEETFGGKSYNFFASGFGCFFSPNSADMDLLSQ